MPNRWFAAIAVSIPLGLLVLLSAQPESWATGSHKYRVIARFVDADTLQPLEGVAVLAQPNIPTEGDWESQPCPWLPLEDWYPKRTRSFWGGMSDASGNVDFRHSELWCVGTSHDPPEPFWADGGVCVVGKPGYGALEIPWRIAKKTKRASVNYEEPDATVDFGTVKLKRESAK